MLGPLEVRVYDADEGHLILFPQLVSALRLEGLPDGVKGITRATRLVTDPPSYIVEAACVRELVFTLAHT